MDHSLYYCSHEKYAPASGEVRTLSTVNEAAGYRAQIVVPYFALHEESDV
jgi:hypothetical protein